MSAQPPYRSPSSPPPGYPGSPPGRSVRVWLIVGAVVALLVIGGLGYWLGGRDSSTPSVAAPSSGTSPSVAALTASASVASTAPSASASAAPSAVPSTSASAASAVPSTVASPTSTTSSPTPSPTPTTTPFTHPDPDFGYVRTVVTKGSATTLTFDRATLYTGAAAASAAKAHHQVSDDDYFIVNDNPLIRTFTLAPTATVTGSVNLIGDVGPKPSTLGDLKAWVSAHPKQSLPVDLGYDDKTGQVTSVTEVYFP